jgi:arylsulfatase A-like enzyme
MYDRFSGMPDRPNVLFVHTDEQRADTMGCYGNDLVETPHVDRLATEGVTFEEGHCTHPLCCPSRGSLLTGRYPSVHGLWRNGLALPGEETTIAEVLREEGYRTALVGKAHFQPYHADPDVFEESTSTLTRNDEEVWEFWREFDGPYYGFDRLEMTYQHGHREVWGGHYGLWIREEHPEALDTFPQEAALEPTNPEYNTWKSAVPAELHSSTWVADRTIDVIEENAGDDPFYAWVGFPDPHFPFNPPAPYCYRYDPEDVDLPVDSAGEVWDGRGVPRYVTYHLEEKYGIDWREVPEDVQREMIAHYYAMIDLIDDQFGRILDALEAEGVAENTVVVFTSDHGDWLGEHGLYGKGIPHSRGLTRVPWVMRWPGVAEAGRRVDAPTSHVDLVPTLLDACGAEIPYGVQGESLRPVLTGEREALRPFALVEHRHEAHREGSFLARNIADSDVDELSAMDSIVNWTDEDIYVETVYADDHRLSYVTGVPGEYGELFDLEADPDEMDNLWDDDPERWRDLLPYLVEALVHAKDPLPERKYPV